MDNFYNLFVPRKIALGLIELGYDDDICFAYFNEISHKKYSLDPHINENAISHIKAPLWQQAIDFLRNKYKVDIYFQKYFSHTPEGTIEHYDYQVARKDGCLLCCSMHWEDDVPPQITYEEARKNALENGIARILDSKMKPYV